MIQSQVWRKRPWHNSIFSCALETKTDGNSEKDVYWGKQAGPQGKWFRVTLGCRNSHVFLKNHCSGFLSVTFFLKKKKLLKENFLFSADMCVCRNEKYKNHLHPCFLGGHVNMNRLHILAICVSVKGTKNTLHFSILASCSISFSFLYISAWGKAPV